MSYPATMYPGLIAVTVTAQGLVGFVAWPLLTEVEPFGAHAWTRSWDVLLLLAPTVLLYVWPLVLERGGPAARKGVSAEEALCPSGS